MTAWLDQLCSFAPARVSIATREHDLAEDLAAQLASSLGSSYTIERELGGGGMSRVFLARDIALGRAVVIKVLLPELAAGVNAERFDREVLLSARLQHPHIVPVLTAGSVNGLPYYVMPYVKGETLRARLANGPLPIPEVVSVLSDVAKALAFAQSEQVVHRDIKPDNILLSGGAATVADFGIAKAITSARQSEPGATLTSMGTSLGTPAYMAPEQVAGDPDVDHRADIYSLGCVAYEMLTGHAPFEGKSPQQLLAAHVMETPLPIASRRPGVPASLVSLVERCMAKEPAARPQSASELVGQLESTATHQALPVVPRRTRRAAPALILAGIVLAVAAVPAYRALRKAPVANGALTFAVAPFEVFDPQLALWKEGIVDVLSRNLDGAGSLRAIAPSVAIRKWEGHGDRTTATKFGQSVGAQLVIYGQLQAAGRDLVEAKVWIMDTGRDAAPQEIMWRDSTARMDRVNDSLSVKVLAAIGRDHAIGAGRIASLGSGSLPAIKAFLQGAQHMRHSQWDSATLSFKEAVSLDSTFGIAYLQLAQSLGWTRGVGNAEGVAAERRAGTLVRPGLSARDSLLLTAVGHYSRANFRGLRVPDEVRQAVATAREAAERYPNDAEVWYMLGDFRFHADPTITIREARDYFDRAIAADSDFAPAYIHAIALAYRNGSEAGGRYANAYLRRDPRDFDGEGVRVAAKLTSPGVNERDIQQTLAALTFDVGRKTYTALTAAPDSAEVAIRLVKGGVWFARDSASRRVASGLLASQLAQRGHIADAWALSITTRSRDAGEIAALGLVPLDSALKVLRPWLAERSEAFLVPIPLLAMAGDTATLGAQVAAMEQVLKSTPTTPQRPAIEYVIASLRAYGALARGDTATATRLFDALPDSVIHTPIDELMRARLVGRQDPQRALSILERLDLPGLVYTARELERGRLAERVGERERAVDAFAYVAAAWRNTESPSLRNAVKEANDALQRLDADSRIRGVIATGVRR